jgi:integrase/recombinase XerD
MTGLRPALAGYLELRRAMGFKLAGDERLLRQFISYLERHGKTAVTTGDALAWVMLPAPASTSWLGYRMSAVRGFAAYLRTLDPAAEVPPAGLLPGRKTRAVPYLYSAAGIDALITQARQIRTPLPAMATYIALMAATGMRGGEVAALDDSDFDPGDGLLLVRGGKNGKHRLLPLHPTTTAALGHYRQLRDQDFPWPRSSALLVTGTGQRVRYSYFGGTFADLARRAGLHARPGGARPRPHDLRHTFAVTTLLDWLRDGGDVAARLPLLSAWLGHASPEDTYWYLHASPELLAEAARRLEPGTGQPS